MRTPEEHGAQNCRQRNKHLRYKEAKAHFLYYNSPIHCSPVLYAPAIFRKENVNKGALCVFSPAALPGNLGGGGPIGANFPVFCCGCRGGGGPMGICAEAAPPGRASSAGA